MIQELINGVKMKRIKLLLFIAFLTTTSILTCNVYADNNMKMGIGINHGANTIYLPLNIIENIQLEPEFSYYDYNMEDDQYVHKNKRFSVGIGIFPKINLELFDFYYGLRAGYIKTDTYSRNGKGYYIAPTLGTEYFFTKRISIGGEAQLKYSEVKGDIINQPDVNKFEEEEINIINHLMFRFYF